MSEAQPKPNNENLSQIEREKSEKAREIENDLNLFREEIEGMLKKHTDIPSDLKELVNKTFSLIDTEMILDDVLDKSVTYGELNTAQQFNLWMSENAIKKIYGDSKEIPEKRSNEKDKYTSEELLAFKSLDQELLECLAKVVQETPELEKAA